MRKLLIAGMLGLTLVFSGCSKTDEHIIQGVTQLKAAVDIMTPQNVALCEEKIAELQVLYDNAVEEEKRDFYAQEIARLEELLAANKMLPEVIEELRKWAAGEKLENE